MTRFTSTDPATEAVNWEGEAASPVQVQAAVDAARAAFPAWADAPRADRIDAVKRYQAVLKDRAPQIAEAIARETGKPLWETKTEAAAMIGKVDISIRAYDERTGERTSDTAFGRATLRHRPHGVAAVLGPFNFPGHLPNGHIVPALLAGDTVVFKPSEETPLVGQVMAEAFDVVGLVERQRQRVRDLRAAAAAELERAEARARLVPASLLAPFTAAAAGSDRPADVGRVLETVRAIATQAVPALRARSTLVRYDAYLHYLDELTTLYTRELRVVDIGRFRAAVGRRAG